MPRPNPLQPPLRPTHLPPRLKHPLLLPNRHRPIPLANNIRTRHHPPLLHRRRHPRQKRRNSLRSQPRHPRRRNSRRNIIIEHLLRPHDNNARRIRRVRRQDRRWLGRHVEETFPQRHDVGSDEDEMDDPPLFPARASGDRFEARDGVGADHAAVGTRCHDDFLLFVMHERLEFLADESRVFEVRGHGAAAGAGEVDGPGGETVARERGADGCPAGYVVEGACCGGNSVGSGFSGCSVVYIRTMDEVEGWWLGRSHCLSFGPEHFYRWNKMNCRLELCGIHVTCKSWYASGES